MVGSADGVFNGFPTLPILLELSRKMADIIGSALSGHLRQQCNFIYHRYQYNGLDAHSARILYEP
jgi:hypothetical protein